MEQRKKADRERHKRKRDLEEAERSAKFNEEVNRLAAAESDDSDDEQSDLQVHGPVWAEPLFSPQSNALQLAPPEANQRVELSADDQDDSSDISTAENDCENRAEVRENVFEIPRGYHWYSSDGEPDESSDDDSSDENYDLKDFIENDEEDDDETLKASLAQWALKFNVSHAAIDGLLPIFREHGHDSLPKRATTLLGTVRNISKNIQKIAGGDYWYRGIKNYLESYFEPEMSCTIDGQKSVKLDIFIDGLSPYKAPTTKCELWPIAGRIICKGFKTKPFLIALWCGSKKSPTDLGEFLGPFVEECKELFKGFVLKGISYKFVLRHIIADAPARAWLKRVLQHNCKISCERCDIRGIWLYNRVLFDPKGKGLPRTDETFANRIDSEYHVGDSPLEEIVKMVSQFPLDRLHLIDLGVMRRIIKFLLEPKASSMKLRSALVEKLDWLCNELFKYFPSEFKRKPKSISDFRAYKGTEFKRILHYDGILLFHYLSVIDAEYQGVYNCFKILSFAIRILSDENLCRDFVPDARQLLEKFVSYSAEVFGGQFVVYNVHHLLHIPDDAEMHGILDGFSAELHESYLGRIKKFLRAPGRTLTQTIARTLEREKNGIIENYSTDFNKALLMFPQGYSRFDHGLTGEMFGEFKTDDFSIVASSRVGPDNCCITKNGDVILVENIVKVEEKVHFIGRKFQETTPFFDFPMPSTVLGIQTVQNLSAVKSHWCVKSDVSKKCVLMPIPHGEEKTFIDGCYLVVPMQHTHHYVD